MTRLPRWWWVSMAIWPITGVPVIAYGFYFFGHLPWISLQPRSWTVSGLAAMFAIYHPLILLPFALLKRAVTVADKPNGSAG